MGGRQSNVSTLSSSQDGQETCFHSRGVERLWVRRDEAQNRSPHIEKNLKRENGSLQESVEQSGLGGGANKESTKEGPRSRQ